MTTANDGLIVAGPSTTATANDVGFVATVVTTTTANDGLNVSGPSTTTTFNVVDDDDDGRRRRKRRRPPPTTINDAGSVVDHPTTFSNDV